MSLATVPQDSLGELDCRRYDCAADLRDHVDRALRQRLHALDEDTVAAVSIDVSAEDASVDGLLDQPETVAVVSVQVSLDNDEDDCDGCPVRRVVAAAVRVAHSTGRLLRHNPDEIEERSGRAYREAITIPVDTEVPR